MLSGSRSPLERQVTDRRRCDGSRRFDDPDRGEMIVDPEIKTRWLEALRSGRYRRGQYRLHLAGSRATATEPRHEPEYCCLGVLCQLAIDAGVVARRRVAYARGGNDDDLKRWVYEYFDPRNPDDDRSRSSLPHVVVRWAGLESRDPSVHGFQLSQWNDLHDKNFVEIAGLVEEYA